MTTSFPIDRYLLSDI